MFETQGSPAVLRYNHLPSIMLEPNEMYHQTTTFSFGIRGQKATCRKIGYRRWSTVV
ncbi:hypothetical protein [Virgibacillus dokdonensis]|uniref:hypothetical protein n=1 Tax=Virgibacillus dokdonensis TaxID=302167 RepID=UPI0015F29A90|nr:hypothetical protein [Virgibacillus dokdonensis]